MACPFCDDFTGMGGVCEARGARGPSPGLGGIAAFRNGLLSGLPGALDDPVETDIRDMLTPAVAGKRQRRELVHLRGGRGAPGGTRTPGPLLRRQLLYPTELRAPGDHCARERSHVGYAQVALCRTARYWP